MTNEEKKYDVFISYSHEDKLVADAILNYLESNKVRCFIDYRDLPKGPNWTRLLPSAIRNSRLMLAIFSKDFNKSTDTDNEITIASNRKIPILVFRITDDDFDGTKEYYLTKSNWIEAFPEPEKNFGELHKNICILLGIKYEQDGNPEILLDKKSYTDEEELVQKGLSELKKDDGDKEMATYYFRKSAKNGYPKGEYLIGKAYYEGNGIPHSWKHAIKWLTLSAEHGNSEAMYWLGRIYHYGIGGERNSMKALELYTKSADLGNGRAMKELGKVYHTGELGVINENRSSEFYEKAWEVLYEKALGENDGESQQVLGNSYLDGEGVEKSYTYAVKLYNRAIANKCPDGYNSLGICYSSGLGVRIDEKKSHELQLQAAKLGLPIAMNNVSKNFFYGNGVEKSIEKYHEWQQRAAECGNSSALHSIGVDYYWGEDCEKNIKKAQLWFEKAIYSGSLDAMVSLGVMYENEEVDADNGQEKAFSLYLQAAVCGHVMSSICLGNCYYNGKGTPENDIEAERWYLKVANIFENMKNAEESYFSQPSGSGFTTICEFDNYKESFSGVFKNLAWIYRNSSKVPHDEEKARKYERWAFELDPDDKQLESNIASTEDIIKTEEAAKKGNPDALDKLLTAYNDNQELIEKWATFAVSHHIFVKKRDYMSNVDHIDLVLKNAKVDIHIFVDYIQAFLDLARESEDYSNCYSLFNVACDEYKKGNLNISDDNWYFIRKDAQELVENTLCVGYLRKRREHFDVLFPGYAPEKIENGDLSNERDFKLFYAAHTEFKSDNIVTDFALSDIFKPFYEVKLRNAIIASGNAKVVNVGDFAQALVNFIDAYNNLCEKNPNIQKEHIDKFGFEMLVPVASPVQMQDYGMQAMKALISVRSLFGDKWLDILESYNNHERLLDIAEVMDFNQDLQLLLIEYVEIQIELDEFFQYIEKVQTMYFDNNRQGIADELNAYVNRLKENSISNNLPYFTIENLPNGSCADDESEIDNNICDDSADDPESQNQLGENYYYGQNGKQQDYSKAARWYRKAADRGHMYAQYNLAFCYDRGLGVPALPFEAAKWYKKAAEQGHAPSQCNLGLCYETGEGVIKNLEEAVNWYTKSAEQGYAAAQCNLGYCYKNGIGIKQDDVKAVGWYLKAAEQGSARAQDLLGDCYLGGQGVEQDESEAVRWYKKSAEQNYASGQYDLAWCYEKGLGIEQNIEIAKEWYEKAAQNGHKGAIKELERINSTNNEEIVDDLPSNE